MEKGFVFTVALWSIRNTKDTHDKTIRVTDFAFRKWDFSRISDNKLNHFIISIEIVVAIEFRALFKGIVYIIFFVVLLFLCSTQRIHPIIWCYWTHFNSPSRNGKSLSRMWRKPEGHYSSFWWKRQTYISL